MKNFQKKSIKTGIALSSLIFSNHNCSADTTPPPTLKPTLPSVIPSPIATLNPDSVAASFNGKNIKVSDIDKEIEKQPRLAFFAKNASQNPSMANRLRKMALDGMINRELLLGESKANTVIDDKTITAKIDEIIAQYGGKDKLNEMLAGMHSDFPTFEKEVSSDLRIKEYITSQLAKGITATDEEINKAFSTSQQKYAKPEEVRAQHILIMAKADGTDAEKKEAETKINAIYESVKKPGADFGAIAKEKSDDKGSAVNGGELGFFRKGMMVPDFEKVAFALKVGEISAPVKSQFGYHIIKLEEKHEAKPATIEDAKPAIEQEIKNAKTDEIVKKKIEELRKKADVQVKLADLG